LDQKSSEETTNGMKLGFYTSILTAITTVVTFAIAFFTPPLSGPWCRVPSCFAYPFTEIISRFPRDYIWMYPAMILILLYFALMVCIHNYAPKEKKVFSQIGLAFALMSSIFLLGDYFVQVSVIQPSLVHGETEGIAILTQYNSHGIFIALEEIGYFMMSLAFLFMAPVFSKTNKAEKAIRISFIASFILTLASLILISLQYGINREYRFELIVISINWIALIVSSIFLSKIFKKAQNKT